MIFAHTAPAMIAVGALLAGNLVALVVVGAWTRRTRRQLRETQATLERTERTFVRVVDEGAVYGARRN